VEPEGEDPGVGVGGWVSAVKVVLPAPRCDLQEAHLDEDTETNSFSSPGPLPLSKATPYQEI
jgi:hypothetical protein